MNDVTDSFVKLLFGIREILVHEFDLFGIVGVGPFLRQTQITWLLLHNRDGGLFIVGEGCLNLTVNHEELMLIVGV